jgi:hypothetical protein
VEHREGENQKRFGKHWLAITTNYNLAELLVQITDKKVNKQNKKISPREPSNA